MKRKTEKLIGLLLVLMVIMACSVFGGGSGDENVPAEEPAPSVEEEAGSEEESPTTEEIPAADSGLCANEYYPVSNGASWSYQGTSSETEDYVFSNTITAVRDDGFTVTVEFDEVTLVQEWSCTSDGILALDMGGGAAGTLTTDNVNLIMDTQNSSGITYPKEITPGKTWQHGLEFTGTMDLNGETFEVSGNTIYSYSAVGTESVSVPAGVFDAMRLDIVTTINMNMNMGGSEVPVTVTSTGSSWLVKDVGWVKSVSSSDIAGFSTTETIELTAYSIP